MKEILKESKSNKDRKLFRFKDKFIPRDVEGGIKSKNFTNKA